MIQLAEDAGQLQHGAVADFARVAADRGQPFVTGWNRHIIPHWKPLLTSGTIAACLAASESCIDAAGNLSSHIAQSAGEVLATVATEAIAGTAKGAGESVVENFRGPDGIWLILGLALLILALVVVSGLRWAIVRMARWVIWLPRRFRRKAVPAQSPTQQPRPSLRNRDI